MANLKFAGSGQQSTATTADVPNAPAAASNNRLPQTDAGCGQRPGSKVSWAPSSQVLWISCPAQKLRVVEHS